MKTITHSIHNLSQIISTIIAKELYVFSFLCAVCELAGLEQVI